MYTKGIVEVDLPKNHFISTSLYIDFHHQLYILWFHHSSPIDSHMYIHPYVQTPYMKYP